MPSDEILKELIIKLLKDKGVIITYKLVDYVITRIERSYEAVNLFIQDLNNISLEKKKYFYFINKRSNRKGLYINE